VLNNTHLLHQSFSRLLCKLGLHDWQTDLYGYQFKGNVYPLRVRHCKRCQLKGKEIYKEALGVASWQNV